LSGLVQSRWAKRKSKFRCHVERGQEEVVQLDRGREVGPRKDAQGGSDITATGDRWATPERRRRAGLMLSAVADRLEATLQLCCGAQTMDLNSAPASKAGGAMKTGTMRAERAPDGSESTEDMQAIGTRGRKPIAVDYA